MKRIYRQAQQLDQWLAEDALSAAQSTAAQSTAAQSTTAQSTTADAHPPADDELTAAWEAAERLRHSRTAFEPAPAFLQASRQRLTSRLQSRPLGWRLRLQQILRSWRDLRLGYRWSLQGAWLSLLLAVLFSLGQFMSAAALALPGDPLYPFKLAREELQLWGTFSAGAKAQLHSEFARQRLLEIQALVLENRYEYLPITVQRYGRHVRRALDQLHQAALRDPQRSRQLAASLQEILTGQAGLMPVIANLAPQQSQGEFYQLIAITQGGLLSINEVLKPSGQAPLEEQVAWQSAG